MGKLNFLCVKNIMRVESRTKSFFLSNGKLFICFTGEEDFQCSWESCNRTFTFYQMRNWFKFQPRFEFKCESLLICGKDLIDCALNHVYDQVFISVSMQKLFLVVFLRKNISVNLQNNKYSPKQISKIMLKLNETEEEENIFIFKNLSSFRAILFMQKLSVSAFVLSYFFVNKSSTFLKCFSFKYS